MAGKRTNGSEAGIIDAENLNPGAAEPVAFPPRGDGGESGGIPTVEPTSIPRGSDEPKRGRGRPKGSSTGAAASGSARATEKETSQDLTAILLSTHMMLAAFLQVPELELDANEAKRLGDAVARVNKLYGGFMLSEKSMAWINLMMAGGAVYGPRVVAYGVRAKKERKKEPVTINQTGAQIH